LQAPDAATFRRSFVRARRAALIEGWIDRWPAMNRWSPEYFRRRWPGAQIEGFAVEGGHALFDPHKGPVLEAVRLDDFLDSLEGKRRVTHRLRIGDFTLLPGLLDDAPDWPELRARLGHERQLWFSGPNTTTRLHFDQAEVMLAQVIGTKTVTLFPPGQSWRMYPQSLFSAGQFSRIDLSSPDEKGFPRLAGAQPWTGVLSPGRVLYIPAGWWHFLHARDLTISIGTRWARWSGWPRFLAAEWWKRARGLTR
jgi:hypothetical protein